MKGLLLKDWYMMTKYCRAYLLIAAIFIGVSFMDPNNSFFVFYPCVLCGMIPMNLLAYDERSGWMSYSGTLPYTRSQIVSAKYLIGLMTQAAMLILTGIAQTVNMTVNGNFDLGSFMVTMLIMLIISLLSSCIALPFVFKLGVERGRIYYYIMVGVVCAASIAGSNIMRAGSDTQIDAGGILCMIAAVGVGLYALSWYVSIVFFKKREL